MKKFLIVFHLSCTLTIFADAQEYKKFKFGLAFMLADFVGENESFTYPFLTLEPAYRISDAVAVGFRTEVTAGFGGTCACEVRAIGTYSVNGQYYLGSYKLRPFVGAGFGLFGFAEARFGFYPRVGFDVKHFSMALDYNILPPNKIYNIGDNSDYLSIRIGGFFGGGKN